VSIENEWITYVKEKNGTYINHAKLNLLKHIRIKCTSNALKTNTLKKRETNSSS